MVKNRFFSIIIATTFSLLTALSCSAQDLKPFVTDKEMQREYIILWEYGECVDHWNANEPLTFEQTKKVAQYYKGLEIFYQRLFRTIVAKDIKSGVEYTKLLGLKIDQNNRLTMALLPITDGQKHLHRLLLCAWWLGDKNALPYIRDLWLQRINHTQSAASFFPQIVICEDDDSVTLPCESSGCFDPNVNKIYIRKRLFSLRHWQTVLHEFTHRRQRAQGLEMGGLASRPLSAYNTTILSVATEIDAELRGCLEHPHPYHLINMLEYEYPFLKKIVPTKESLITDNIYPYFTVVELYGNLCSYYIANKTNRQQTLVTNLYKAQYDLQNEMVAWERYKKTPSFDVLKFTSYQALQNIDSFYAQNAKLFMQCNKGINYTDLNPKAYDLFLSKSLCGSTEFFELKKKCGLIPK